MILAVNEISITVQQLTFFGPPCILVPVRACGVGEEAREGVSKRRHVMQVVNDDDARRRAPADDVTAAGRDVIVTAGGRHACALLGHVGEVLTQLA